MSSEQLVERIAKLVQALPTAQPGRYPDADSRTFTVGRAGKVFALVLFAGDQPGVHLRSNDQVVRADPRVAASSFTHRRIEYFNNFIWLRDVSQWADAELARLLHDSLTLAKRKDGGVKRGNEFRDLALIVRKALVETPAELRPKGPHHAGGPAAKIVGHEGPFAAALARWVVDQFEPVVSAAARPVFDAYRQALRDPAQRERLRPILDATPATVRAERALVAAHFSLGAYDPISGPGLASRAFMQWHAQLLERSAAQLTALLTALDDTVLNAEFRALAHLRAKRQLPGVERVLWRGADAKGNAGHWVARLAKGQYASLQKLGTRWAWLEGSRDDVLACVPDVAFAAASTIALARDLPAAHGLPIDFQLTA